MAKNYDEKPFGDVAAGWKSQLLCEAEEIAPTEEVLSLLKAESFEELLSLGKALDRQLRYRESIEVYTRAIALDPMSLEALRLRAGRYLSTLQVKNALRDFAGCLSLGGDKAEIWYRMGICHYFAGEYREAMEVLERAYPLFDEEMGVAVMYWHTMAALREKKSPSLLYRGYEDDMDIGHHTAYHFAMSAAAGKLGWDEIEDRLAREEDDLEYSIMAYGAAQVGKSRGHGEEAEKLLETVLDRDSFWISFGWLAAFADRQREN